LSSFYFFLTIMIERLPPQQLVTINCCDLPTSTEQQQFSCIDYEILNTNSNIATPTTATSAITIVNCSNCLQPIDDKYILCVANKTYHRSCLKCHQCHQLLDDESTCYFLKDGRFFCRNDYYKRFSGSSSNSSSHGYNCQKCHQPISTNDLIMRVSDDCLYHVGCFSCSLCNQLLKTGDDYGLNGNNSLLCRLHFEQTASLLSPPELTMIDIDPVQERSSIFSRQQQQQSQPNNKKSSRQTTNRGKRKLMMTTNNVENEYTGFLGCGDDNNIISGSENGEIGGGNCLFQHQPMTLAQQQRQKRNRTSFKHHQLRIMKTFFSQNHNPDSKGLKLLAQKTGLTKRVLQVWFQNARAKHRRTLLQEQENKQKSSSSSAASTSGAGDNSTTSPTQSKITLNRKETEILQMLTDEHDDGGSSNDLSRGDENEDSETDEFINHHHHQQQQQQQQQQYIGYYA